MNYRELFEHGKFKTSNTPLAAYLKSEGFEIQDIDYSNPNAFIIFSDDCQTLKDAVRNWHTCRAMGNVSLYQEAYHDLVCKIKLQQALK